MNNNNKILIIGHRGANNIAPENTLKAFKKAIELEADFIEFDVQMSRDGELVITHDLDIERLTGEKKYVKDLTLVKIENSSHWVIHDQPELIISKFQNFFQN